MKRAVLLVLLAACSPPDLTPVPGQGLFTAIVWHDVYGQADKAPAIEWRRDLVTCERSDGTTGPGYWHDGVCQMGNWVSGDSFVTVADLPDFHDRSQMVAHEYLHVFLARAGRDDPDHRQPEWAEGGLFDRAIDALAKAGW